MTSRLAQLAAVTEIVADTGDLAAIRRLKPVDATTNPSLLLKLARSDDGNRLLADANHLARALSRHPDLTLLTDAFAAIAGQAISAEISGLISTEVDARLSFDTSAMLTRARRLHWLYRELGVPASRVLIKLATTWQGVKAAEVLELEGIACNMTLLFNLVQAKACADAGVTLVSPFVGRIYDWHKKQGKAMASAVDDPGVQSVLAIHQAYMAHGVPTIIMGASFRSTQQIEALAGCDKLTISPALIDELAAQDGVLPLVLDRQGMASEEVAFGIGESRFHLEMAQDAMATELLADGIRRFIVDQEALENCFR